MEETERQETLQELRTLIAGEIKLYEQYLKILEAERKVVVASDTRQVLLLSSERAIVIEKLQQAHEARRKLLRRYSADRLLKLTSFVQQFFTQKEAAGILPEVQKLKTLATRAQSYTGEFSQVVGFSLKLVSGLVSILWSATQNVVRGYNCLGKVRESYHPAGYRTAGVLKQA